MLPGNKYEAADLPIRMLFVVTARPTERPTTVEKLLEVQGVLGLRETLTGHRNLYVGVVGKNASDVARVLGAIQDLNLEINSSEIGRERCLQPLEGFQTGGGTVGDGNER